MTLVVVGDMARQQIVEAARALFVFPVPLTTGTERVAELPTPVATGGAAAALPDPGPLAGIVRSQADRTRPRSRHRDAGLARAVRAGGQDVVALDVLLLLLASGANGTGGRVGEALVRQQQVALAVSADYQTRRAPGLLRFPPSGRAAANKQSSRRSSPRSAGCARTA
jgi:predicted Zn-dependent peptidase